MRAAASSVYGSPVRPRRQHCVHFQAQSEVYVQTSGEFKGKINPVWCTAGPCLYKTPWQLLLNRFIGLFLCLEQ
ncbi:hypothetical protein XENTR_v10004227 [Xenopus tropicalis]|nr:hypothetical protein XENTR_v10004227 [Xenopus tropicalis]